jgi:hypothetical protein
MHLAEGRSEVEVRALAQLASAMTNGKDEAILSISPPPSTNEMITDTPPSVLTATSSPIPSSTPRPIYVLQSVEKVCDLNLVSPQIQVVVEDAGGNGIPGVRAEVIWDQGEDHFFTGMKPELGLGYADFSMDVEVTYILQLENTDNPVTDLQSDKCELTEGGTFPGSVRLRFERP